jgi:hypothetical protein
MAYGKKKIKNAGNKDRERKSKNGKEMLKDATKEGSVEIRKN